MGATMPSNAVKAVISLLLAMAFSLPAQAAPASAASVEKLLAVNGAQKGLETAVSGIEAQVRQQVISNLVTQNGGTALNAQQQLAVDKSIPGIGIILRQEMGWARLKAPYISLYQSQLSQAEVDRLIQLYQDPSYVSLIQKLQGLNQQSAQLIAQKLPAIMQRVAPVLEEALNSALGQ